MMHVFMKIKVKKWKLSSINLHSVHIHYAISTNRFCVFAVFLCTQDIRRFFQPTSSNPAVQKPAPHGGIKKEEKKKKNPLSSDEEVKKKETAKANESSSEPVNELITLFLHPNHQVLLLFHLP